MLRLQQLRLNRRTKKIEKIRGAEDLEEIISKESKQAADLQQKIIEMTEGIMEKEAGG